VTALINLSRIPAQLNIRCELSTQLGTGGAMLPPPSGLLRTISSAPPHERSSSEEANLQLNPQVVNGPPSPADDTDISLPSVHPILVPASGLDRVGPPSLQASNDIQESSCSPGGQDRLTSACAAACAKLKRFNQT